MGTCSADKFPSAFPTQTFPMYFILVIHLLTQCFYQAFKMYCLQNQRICLTRHWKTACKGRMAHAFILIIQEEDECGFLHPRPSWSTQWVPGWPELYNKNKQAKTSCVHLFFPIFSMSAHGNSFLPFMTISWYSLLLCCVHAQKPCQHTFLYSYASLSHTALDRTL